MASIVFTLTKTVSQDALAAAHTKNWNIDFSVKNQDGQLGIVEGTIRAKIDELDRNGGPGLFRFKGTVVILLGAGLQARFGNSLRGNTFFGNASTLGVKGEIKVQLQ